MSQAETYRFQVNLSGMINILSNHLYSNPKVYLRELMQNGTDAISARNLVAEEGYTGSILIETAGSGDNVTLSVEDNGIGLNESEVHEFLAMIGQSSKRGEDFLAKEESFIGRFGIGLLSCFMVSDEIVMVTRSAKGGPALQWSGKPDGTYSIRRLETELSPGTKVYLRCKPGCGVFFEPDNIKRWLHEYGALLPFPVVFRTGDDDHTVNPALPVWIEEPGHARSHRDEVLLLGKQLLGETFHDFIPLVTEEGRTGGIAYVLPQTVNLNVKKSHRVYLKRMLVSEKAENILPDWAFFVKCVIWTDELQPTASRESFYENDKLADIREQLGLSIRSELMRMAEYDPDRLQQIIERHALSMKALAAEDPSFYSIVYRWLSFETTFGRKKLGDLLEERQHLYYTESLDEYRQITHVAAAQALLVVNGGYVYDAELIARLPQADPQLTVERLLPEDVSLAFQDLTPQERMSYYEGVRLADATLQRFRCQIQLRRFKPADLPALFTLSKDSADMRSLETSKGASTPLLSSVLGNLENAYKESAYATLYFNLDNPVISRIFQPDNQAMLPSAVEMLYCNALMMGHYPMSRQELELLNKGIVQFIDWGLRQPDNQGNGGHDHE